MENLLIIGAGIMGRGIAYCALLGGYQVTLVDAFAPQLEKARALIEKDLRKGVELGKVAAAAANEALTRLTMGSDYDEAAGQADLVVEAVSEDLALKLSIFEKLDCLCPPKTILATNTSALGVTEIAAATQNPGRVLGMHFFNPVPKMKLVEIVRGLETTAEAIKAVEDAAIRMGKETVIVNDYPGFATSRLNVLIGNEAFYMLMEGVASPEDIDKAAKLGLNHPMGPLEMSDLVGLDTRLKVLQHLHRTLGERFRPCPLMLKYVQSGRLGRKVGKGVYDYENK